MRLIRTFHQEWPDKIPGDEHGDVEYAITRDEWAVAARNLNTRLTTATGHRPYDRCREHPVDVPRPPVGRRRRRAATARRSWCSARRRWTSSRVAVARLARLRLRSRRCWLARVLAAVGDPDHRRRRHHDVRLPGPELRGRSVASRRSAVAARARVHGAASGGVARRRGSRRGGGGRRRDRQRVRTPAGDRVRLGFRGRVARAGDRGAQRASVGRARARRPRYRNRRSPTSVCASPRTSTTRSPTRWRRSTCSPAWPPTSWSASPSRRPSRWRRSAPRAATRSTSSARSSACCAIRSSAAPADSGGRDRGHRRPRRAIACRRPRRHAGGQRRRRRRPAVDRHRCLPRRPGGPDQHASARRTRRNGDGRGRRGSEPTRSVSSVVDDGGTPTASAAERRERGSG